MGQKIAPRAPETRRKQIVDSSQVFTTAVGLTEAHGAIKASASEDLNADPMS